MTTPGFYYGGFSNGFYTLVDTANKTFSAVALGPLDWRISIVDREGRPTPEFQRRWDLQIQNNKLINPIQADVGTPTFSATANTLYINIEKAPYKAWFYDGGNWVRLSPVNFTDLEDVPTSYTTHALKLVRVNSGATGLEFVTVADALDSISATRGAVLYRGVSGWSALLPGTSGQVLTTGGSGADPSWATPSSGGQGYLPLVNGDSPPVLMYASDAQLIGVPFTKTEPTKMTAYLRTGSGAPSGTPNGAFPAGTTALYVRTDTNRSYIWTGTTWSLI